MDHQLETAEVLALVGLTETQLRNDLRDRFLIPPEVVRPGDGRPQVAVWGPRAVRRAKRLYRLRRRGAEGMRLRILLFLADGWGWEHVRETCLKGLHRGLALSLLGVERYTRRGNLDFAIDDIVERQHNALVRTVGPVEGMQPTSEETTRFYVGLLHNGSPLPGGTAKRLTQPLARLLRPDLGERGAAVWAWLFELVVGMLDLRAERLVRLATEAGPDEVERARRLFNQNAWFVRRALRRNAGRAHRGQSFNLLTLCGHAGRTTPAEFAQNPAGMTGAQALGGVFATTLALDLAYMRFVDYWIGMLPVVLRGR